MRHLLAAFAAAILIVAPAVTIPPPANADTGQIVIPHMWLCTDDVNPDLPCTHVDGPTHQVWAGPMPVVGELCTVAAVGNNESVHPGTDLILTSGGQSVTMFDVERAVGADTPADGPILTGETGSIDVRFGSHGQASLDFVITFGCEPPTTTTEAPPSSTTTTTSTTLPSTTTTVTTTPPSTTTTQPTPTTSTTTSTPPPTTVTTLAPPSTTASRITSIEHTITGNCTDGVTIRLNNTGNTKVVLLSVVIDRPEDTPLTWSKTSIDPGKRHTFTYSGQTFRLGGAPLFFIGDYTWTVTFSDDTGLAPIVETLHLTDDDPACKLPPVPEPPPTSSTTTTAPPVVTTVVVDPPPTAPPATSPPELPRTGLSLLAIALIGAVLLAAGGGLVRLSGGEEQ